MSSSKVVALLAGALVLSAAPVNAQGINTQFVISDVQRITPQCRDHPNAPVVGRVSGQLGGVPARGVVFVGCFESFAECERWRRPVSGLISGWIRSNSCEPRR